MEPLDTAVLDALDEAILNVKSSMEINRKMRNLRDEYVLKIDEAMKKIEQLDINKMELSTIYQILYLFKSKRFVNLKENIEQLINTTLNTLLDDILRIKFVDTSTRGTPGIDLFFVDEEDNILDPDICVGNSIRQITSLLYSLAVVGFSGKSKVFFIDELFTGLGEKYSRLTSQIIAELVASGYQIIMVQHNQFLFSHNYCRLLYAKKTKDKGLVLTDYEKLTE